MSIWWNVAAGIGGGIVLAFLVVGVCRIFLSRRPE